MSADPAPPFATLPLGYFRDVQASRRDASILSIPFPAGSVVSVTRVIHLLR